MTSPDNITDFITWKDSDRLKALFSLKNSRYNAQRDIAGLNLGYNTKETDEITGENRKRWFKTAGADPEKTAWGLQVHKDRVQFVEQPGIYPETDGLVTTKPGLALGVFVADCAAVLFVDEENGVVATAHAGWKGAAANIVGKTVAEMEKAGAKADCTEVFISPCISLKNFEVGEEVASQFDEKFVDRSYKKPHVDIRAVVQSQLVETGITEDKISMHPDCTMDFPEKYYSYRREQNKSGRLMGVVFLKPAK